MSDKFIRTVSPFSLAVIAVFDAASVLLIAFAVQKVLHKPTFYTIAFLIIMIFDLITATAATFGLLQNGVRFTKETVTFTTVDDNNCYAYTDIEKVETHKDAKVSLRKNFTERYSSLILYMKDGTVSTVELGLTTKRKLLKVEQEIKKRTDV